MIGNANANGTPFDKAAGGIPPLASNLISWNFKQGFGTSTDDLSSKDYVNDSDEPAKFVSSYCSVHTTDCACLANSESDYLLSTMTLSGWFKTTDADVFCLYGWNYLTKGFYLGMSGGKVTGSMRTTASGSKTLTSTSSYNDGNWHFAAITADGTTLTLYVDSEIKSVGCIGAQLNDQARFCIGGYSDSSISITLRYGNGSMSACDIKYWNDRCLSAAEISSIKCSSCEVVGTPFYNFPMQSIYSLVGNKKLTIAAGANTGLVTFAAGQDFYHRNLVTGCDIWRKTGVSDVYVPYVSGVPVSTDVNADFSTTGYAKIKTCPAGYWHNGCETKIVVGTNGTKDANGWQAWTDARFTTGAFKTNAGVIKTVAQADPNEILISRTTAPIGYCKEIDLNTADPVQAGYYIIFDNTESTKIKNFLWWSGDGEPTNDASANALKFVRKTDFMLSDEGAYLTDDDGHVLCVT